MYTIQNCPAGAARIFGLLYQMLNELYTSIGYYIEIASVVCVKIAQLYGRAGNIDSRTYIQSKLIKRTVFALLK